MKRESAALSPREPHGGVPAVRRVPPDLGIELDFHPGFPVGWAAGGNADSIGRQLLHLQRTAGNHAVQELVMQARGPGIALIMRPPSTASPGGRSIQPSGQPAVQRVGGEKIGLEYLPQDTDEIKTGQDLLREAWQEATTTRHNYMVNEVKPKIEQDAVTMIDEVKQVRAKTMSLTSTKVFQRGFSQTYYARLTSGDLNDPEAALKKAGAFKTQALKIVAEDVQYRTRKWESKAKPAVYVNIAKVKRGTGAFIKKSDPSIGGPAREVFRKIGIKRGLNIPTEKKEYIRDDRGTLTRRYAYVEKNYYQMMEFFMTHHMEGRFASHMKAAGEQNPDLYEHRDPTVDMVRPGDPDPSGKLTPEQMAVAHQKLGSGPQQRGVSLTSTPKVNATYVNTGENFRTNRGFRLKVDLAMIKPGDQGGPVLINHYSHGGVIDVGGYETRRERGATKNKYPYKESAVHARELLIEYLKPEWVVAIEQHDSDNTTGAGAGSTTLDQSTPLVGATTLFEQAKQQFGGTEYKAGFTFGLNTDDLTTAPIPMQTNPHFKEGFAGSRLFVEGWTKGNGLFNTHHGTDEGERAIKGVTMPQHIYDTKDTADEDKFDLFHLGFLRGRSGKVNITSADQLGTLSA